MAVAINWRRQPTSAFDEWNGRSASSRGLGDRPGACCDTMTMRDVAHPSTAARRLSTTSPTFRGRWRAAHAVVEVAHSMRVTNGDEHCAIYMHLQFERMSQIAHDVSS